SDQIGLLDLLAKRGSRLGGNTGQMILRFVGWDGFVTSQDVVACLRDAGLDIAETVTSKGDLAKVQAQFNAWAEETAFPMFISPGSARCRSARTTRNNISIANQQPCRTACALRIHGSAGTHRMPHCQLSEISLKLNAP